MTDRTAIANETVRAGNIAFSNAGKLAFIAGPCQMQSRDHAMDVAGFLKETADRFGVGLVYKSSYDKANRTSANAARGIGLEKSLAVFTEI